MESTEENIKRNFKILYERKIILSKENKKYVDKSKYAFYGVWLILFSIFVFSFAISLFFFSMHPYVFYYVTVAIGSIPIYILFKYFKWLSLQRFRYS